MSEIFAKLTPHTDGRRRRIRLKSLSAVAILPGGSGANPESNVTFYKSAKGASAQIEKRLGPERGGDVVDFATSSTDGHVHGLRIHSDGRDVTLVMHGATGIDSGPHGHEIIRNPDGTFSVSANAGHTHQISAEDIRAALERRVQQLAAPIETPQEQEDSTMPMTDLELAKAHHARRVNLEEAEKSKIRKLSRFEAEDELDRLAKKRAAEQRESYLDAYETVCAQNRLLYNHAVGNPL